jgi:esterase/lipase superfamily enzyme
MLRHGKGGYLPGDGTPFEACTMRIFFGTNRDPNRRRSPNDFGRRFSPNGLTDLRFGWADFPAGDPRVRPVVHVAPEQLVVAPAALERGDLSAQRLGSRAVFEAMRQEMMACPADALLFVHGFNTDFVESLQAAAEVARTLAGPLVVIVFSWPSDGSLLPLRAYASDRDDARASGVALGRGLQKLAHWLRLLPRADHCRRGVHLMAHSMGNYALRWAWQSIRASAGGELRRLFDHVLMVAADEDHDTFEHEHKLKGLPDLARSVTVYHNARDRALMVSDITKGNPERLGAGGPRNALLLPDKVRVVDVLPALAGDDDRIGHHYHVSNAVVRQDLLAVLADVEPDAMRTRSHRPDARGWRLRPLA